MSRFIAHVIPPDTPATGGNAITAERIVQELEPKGWKGVVTRRPAFGGYDFILAYNAWTVGVPLIQSGANPERIAVIWTGTDLWDGLATFPEMIPLLEHVKGHIVFTPNARDRLLSVAPHWESKVHVIVPAVDHQLFRPGVIPPSSHLTSALIAGGLRPVKRTHWAIDLIEAVREKGPQLDLVIAGPSRSDDEDSRVKMKAAPHSWVHLVGEIPRQQMPQYYCRAGCVLNTSAAEGVSNALMEAMACGSCVIATRIPGNAALIDHGSTGFLFDTVEEFVEIMLFLWNHPKQRQEIGFNAHRVIHEQHNPWIEQSQYDQLLSQWIS